MYYKKRLDTYLKIYNLIFNKQLGFKQEIFTKHAIHFLLNNIYNQLDKKLFYAYF